MAETDLSGYAGSVTLPTAHGGAAAGFTVRRTTSQKDVGRYASGSRATQTRLGSITIGGDIRVFLRKGATNTSPGIVGATVPAADGAALTLTLDTGCTLSGTAVFPGLDINHAFDDPAVEGTHAYQFTGPVTEAWASS